MPSRRRARGRWRVGRRLLVCCGGSCGTAVREGGRRDSLQGTSIHVAQHVDGIGAFTGAVGLTCDDAGGEDDQRNWMPPCIDQDAASLGKSVTHPVAWPSPVALTCGIRCMACVPTTSGDSRSPQGTRARRVHMQMRDFRTRKIHPESAPSTSGIEPIGSMAKAAHGAVDRTNGTPPVCPTCGGRT